MRDPSDENVYRLAQQAAEEGRGNLTGIENLSSAAATVRETRKAVRAELEQEVNAVTVRSGQFGFARSDIGSLKKRIDAFIGITGAALLPGSARGAGEVMAEHALARALEVLDQLLAKTRSKHLKGHLARPEARSALATLRTARAALSEQPRDLPGSIESAAGELDEAKGELKNLRLLITGARVVGRGAAVDEQLPVALGLGRRAAERRPAAAPQRPAAGHPGQDPVRHRPSARAGRVRLGRVDRDRRRPGLRGGRDRSTAAGRPAPGTYHRRNPRPARTRRRRAST